MERHIIKMMHIWQHIAVITSQGMPARLDPCKHWTVLQQTFHLAANLHSALSLINSCLWLASGLLGLRERKGKVFESHVHYPSFLFCSSSPWKQEMKLLKCVSQTIEFETSGEESWEKKPGWCQIPQSRDSVLFNLRSKGLSVCLWYKREWVRTPTVVRLPLLSSQSAVLAGYLRTKLDF